MKDKEKQIFKFSVVDNKTGEYPDLYNIALKEDWAKGLMYCDMEGFSINEDGQLILSDECGKFVYCPNDRFTVVFEDSVVLSREELSKRDYEFRQIGYDECLRDNPKKDKYIKKLEHKIDQLNAKLDQSSKETAEKIIDLIKTFCPDKKFIEIVKGVIKKQFGVEIKDV